MSLRRDFALSLILGLQNVLFCVTCSVASTRGLKRISIAAFIMRDINIYRNSYSKGLLNSRKSDHCCFNLHPWSITNHSAILNLDVEKSAVSFLNYVDMSCMMIQNVLLNIVKDGGMFCGGLWKKLVCYNSYSNDGSSGPWFLNGVLSSFLDKCWYLSWWKWDGDG